MIENAQLIYAEIRQLQETALKHKRNYEFWQTLLEAHTAEKPAYKKQGDMWSYWTSLWHIRRMLRRNKKVWLRSKNREESLRYLYKRLTGKGNGADE